MSDVTDEQIEKYFDEYYFKRRIRELEDEILYVFKKYYEKYPFKENDQQWLDFTDYVIKRRSHDSLEKNDE